MFSASKFLIFANQADMYAETAADSVMRSHFLHMAGKWRDLADVADRTEATRPVGPPVN